MIPEPGIVSGLVEIVKANGGLFAIALILLIWLVRELKRNEAKERERTDTLADVIERNTTALNGMQESNHQVAIRVSELIERIYHQEIRGNGDKSQGQSNFPGRSRRHQRDT